MECIRISHSRPGFLRLHLETWTTFLITALGLLLVLSESIDVNGKMGSGSGHRSYSAKISRRPVVIVVAFDGFRYNYFQRTATPHMDNLRDGGSTVRYMRNQFITKTFPNHMSIATGLHVESHGIVDNSFYDPKYNRTLGSLEPEFWNFDNITMPLWTLNELVGQGRRSGVAMWPGGQFPYGSQQTLPSRSLLFNESYPFDARIDKVLEWVTDENDAVNLVYLYFEEPDGHAHAFGPESPEVTKYIQIMDNTTGYLINRLKHYGIYDKVNLIVLSDHGFQEVKQQNMINYTSTLEPGSYRAFGSSPIIHILPNDGRMNEVYSKLLNFSVHRNFTVYKKAEMKNIPQWHYSDNRRIMPIVLVADLGFVFDDFQATMDFYNTKFNLTASPDRVYGTHGYDNRQLSMQPFFIARGPAFRKGYQGHVFDIIDLYPLISRIIGVKPGPNNGSFANVAQLLKRKPRIARAHQVCCNKCKNYF